MSHIRIKELSAFYAHCILVAVLDTLPWTSATAK
jgi:hypothetical protein